MRHPMAMAAIAACLLSVSGQIGGMEAWADATDPKFAAGIIGAIGAALLGIYSPRPVK